MRFNSGSLTLLLSILLNACSAADSAVPVCTSARFSATSRPVVGSAGVNANQMLVTVNGSLCGDSAGQYTNEPCVNVTVCSPSDPSRCQTINNILLDTGSFGLRIFSSVLTIPLSPITQGGQVLGECVQYGDGSSEWGQVEYAYVKLGNEPAVHTPIQVINSAYATPPALCTSSQSTPDTDPQEAGFNGILGVGLFAEDCGAGCLSDVNNGQYFTCNGTDCSCGATVDIAAQVQNPVALLPVDNNGVVLVLPSVTSSGGASSVNGNLYLGIGTQSNNVPSGATAYPSDANGNIITIFSAYNSKRIPSFIDSGSSGLYFPSPAGGQLPDCSVSHGSDWSGTYCPGSVQSFTAINMGALGSPVGNVSFQIGNAFTLLSSGNEVFDDYGSNILNGTSDGTSGSGSVAFDWGLPFFFGKSVYFGLEGSRSSLGAGPYFAY